MTKKDQINGKTLKISLNSNAVDYLLDQIGNLVKENRKIMVVTPNPEFICLAEKDRSFAEILNKANFSLPDGSYLFWAKFLQEKRQHSKNYSKLPLGAKIILSGFWGVQASLKIHFGDLAEKKITGTDFMLELLKLAAKNRWSVFLLGAEEGIAYKAGKKLEKMIPGLKINGYFSGNADPQGDIKSQFEIKKAAKNTGSGRINLLFVAYGMGRQERWIARNLPKIPVNLAMGVGGAFDYYSGKVSRAPLWLRKRSGEWLYRLLKQPWRAKRQLKLLKFLWLILSEKVFLDFKKTE
jgi:N-acetylglucosaminyldiphosphoundecaprenol N-acetyl-beta-D-mannosaminyltransferase